MVTQTASHTYELIEGWAKLQAGVELGYSHGIVLDKQDRVHVFNQSTHAMAVFDIEGNFIRSWGEEFAAGAHDLVLNVEGGTEYLYLVDYAIPAIVKTTIDGEEVLRVSGTPDRPDLYDADRPYKPTGIAVTPSGDFYVCDGYGQSYIHQYKANGEYVRSWGGLGTEPGKMKCAHGICLDTRRAEPQLIVADRANVRLQTFTLDGEHKACIPLEGLRYPCTVDLAGSDMVIPDLHGVVLIYDGDNNLVASIGDNPGVEKREGWPNIPHADRVPGQFISPHGATVDRFGDLYVVEWVSDGRISKFRRT